MRFLYGDSTPFPLGYNFLTTLEAFMASATRIVQLDTEARSLARQTDEAAQSRLRGLDALEQFHTVVMRAVTDTAQKVQHAHALEYARRVAEFASGYVDEHRRGAAGENERDVSHCHAENDKRLGEQRTALDRFLKSARLPVLTTHVAMRLVGDGKETGYQATASYDHPDGIQTSFALAPSRTSTWNHPRRVSELAENVELVVGVDKSWLRGTVTPKSVAVGDWILASFDAGEASFELVLKKKATDKESLVLRLRRTEAGLSGQLEGQGPDAAGGALTPSDLAHLERLWLALKTATSEVLEQREHLVAVALDGQPVFENGLLLPLIVRLVALFSGTVREIAKRSPNEFELSLKIENDGGRREEIYLRKDGIIGQLQPLSAQGRAVFAPLGLDGWLPGTTAAPPPVAMGPSMVPAIVAIPPSPASSPAALPVPPASSPPSGTAHVSPGPTSGSMVNAPPVAPASTRVVGS
jgi:hypothetical protein